MAALNKSFLNNKIFLSISVIIISNLIYYLPSIIYFPSFYSDDFYIFTNIFQSPNSFVSTSPQDYFYLFFRPISYFYFWIDFHIWGSNSFGMKLNNLSLHLILLVVFFYTLIESAKFFKIKLNYILLTSIVLILSFHPDSSFWILWISNSTELLVILFYCLSFLSFLKYFANEKEKNIFLLLYILFFGLSILAKQNSLHLPALIIFISYLFKDRIDNNKFKKIILINIIGFAVVIIFILFNYLFSNIGQELYPNIWKKPFALIGTLVYVVFPFWGEQFYNFFLLNKPIAVVTLLAAFISLFIYVYKKKNYLKLAHIIFFVIIVFIPRIFTAGGNRINSIIIFWFFIAAFIFISKLQSKIIYVFISVYLISILFFSTQQTIMLNNNCNYRLDRVKALSQFIKNVEKKKTLIVISEGTYLYSYEVYFYCNNNFGIEKRIQHFPFRYFFQNRDLKYSSVPLVNGYLRNDTLKIFTASNLLSIFSDINKLKDYHIKILKETDSLGRGISEIVALLPKYYSRDNFNFYLDNVNGWIKL